MPVFFYYLVCGRGARQYDTVPIRADRVVSVDLYSVWIVDFEIRTDLVTGELERDFSPSSVWSKSSDPS